MHIQPNILRLPQVKLKCLSAPKAVIAFAYTNSHFSITRHPIVQLAAVLTHTHRPHVIRTKSAFPTFPTRFHRIAHKHSAAQNSLPEFKHSLRVMVSVSNYGYSMVRTWLFSYRFVRKRRKTRLNKMRFVVMAPHHRWNMSMVFVYAAQDSIWVYFIFAANPLFCILTTFIVCRECV